MWFWGLQEAFLNPRTDPKSYHITSLFLLTLTLALLLPPQCPYPFLSYLSADFIEPKKASDLSSIPTNTLRRRIVGDREEMGAWPNCL